MDWSGDDFAAAADEAKKLGRGVTPEEIDAALQKLAEYSSSYVKRVV